VKKLANAIFLLLLFRVYTCPAAPEVYFTPNRVTDQILIDLIDKAKKSVYVASYSMSWEKMMEKLCSQQGLKDVRVMVDTEPPAKFPRGILKVDKKSTLFHPKFIVIDGQTVIVGSGNFTEGGLHSYHNNFILIRDRRIAGFFNAKFLSWWENRPSEECYSDGTLQLYFAPENDCEEVLIKTISSARRSVRFALYHCTSEEIARVLVRRKLAGVDVCGMVEYFNIEPHSVFYSLRDYGCGMKKSNLAGFLHDKFFIIDGEIVITGSYNPTASARSNTECLLVIKDRETAGKFLKEWTRLWRYCSLP